MKSDGLIQTSLMRSQVMGAPDFMDLTPPTFNISLETALKIFEVAVLIPLKIVEAVL